jgi:NTE family protein
MKSTTFGLVLSGGGVRGMAHIGAIKALEEHGIYPSHIAGASVGAIVGALYAGGYSCDEMVAFFKKTSLFSINNYAYQKPGLIDTDKFYKIFLKQFPEDRFESLKLKLFVSATNIVAGKNKIFEKGQLIHTILASAAFPVVLSPLMIDGTLYADGGITNNFPVEPLQVHCDQIIGSYVSPLKKIRPADLNSSMSVLDRAFSIGMVSMSEQKFQFCDLLFIPPTLNKFATFSKSHIDEIYKIGYSEARKKLETYERKLKL